MTYTDSLVFLFVTDLDRSTSFYESLGLEIHVDQGSCRILGVDGRLMVGICGDRTPSPDGLIFTLVTDRVEDVCARLMAQGVVFEQEPRYSAEYAITHAFLRDPDGHLVEIQRFESA